MEDLDRVITSGLDRFTWKRSVDYGNRSTYMKLFSVANEELFVAINRCNCFQKVKTFLGVRIYIKIWNESFYISSTI